MNKNKSQNPTHRILLAIVVSIIVIWTHNISKNNAMQKKSTFPSTPTDLNPSNPSNPTNPTNPDKPKKNRGSELTALILNWKTPRTLANTLRSYQKNGLFDYMNETVIFFQELTKEQEEKAKSYHNKIRVIGEKTNVNIHWGIEYLVDNATTEYVLFLEKDWELIESPEMLAEEIDAAIEIIESGVADVVRLRSRNNPGRDFYAKETYQGKEDDVWHRQENLMCNFYHWIENFDWRFPDKAVTCWNNPLFYCVKARFCNWTNNPGVFKKSWWKKYMSQYARKTAQEMKTWGNFESELNSVVEAWNGSPWVVAMGRGLFAHHEIDG
eukprot:c12436_g1_i1.p1 GENE.c12436_g1_i1~~c12436_g1_i1.p1  ORF type:complete len:336 (-),score=121.54 c12436_g1_i1:225-1199(-)